MDDSDALSVAPNSELNALDRSWLEVGPFAQTLIISWPSVTKDVDVGFEDC